MAEGKFGLTAENPIEGPESLEDLALSFKPKAINRNMPSVTELDRVAEELGFASREQARPRRRRKLEPMPTRFVAIRMTEPLFARFLSYADKHQLKYAEAVERLLDRADDPD